MLDLGEIAVDLETGVISGAREGRLTNRELALLRFLAQRPGQVVDRDTLLHEVFDYAPRTVSRAVDKAVDSLRAKIEPDKRLPVYLVGVHGRGYRFVPRRTQDSQIVSGCRFVGREREREMLQAAIHGAPGPILLVGPGGAGKSRLVTEAFRGFKGVRSCDLSPCRTEEDVLRAIEAALEISTQAGDSLARSIHLALVLAGCEVTLILDGVEPVAEALRAILPALSSRTPVVATSRVRLDLPQERVIAVDALPRSDAVALFRDRSGPVVGSDEEIGAVVDLVDRLPLAIELAARRSRLLSVSDLSARLARSHALLSGDGHRRGVRATVAWSWGLLDPVQQDALRQINVFAGGFEIDAAEAVLDLPPDAPPVVDVLQGLLDASLLRRSADGRLAPYETVRQFVCELAEIPRDLSRRHGRWYGALAFSLARATRYGAAALDDLEREMPNLYAVFARGSAADPQDQVRARIGVAAWMRVRGNRVEQIALWADALEASDGVDVELRVEVLFGRALAPGRGQLDVEAPLVVEALTLARASGIPALHLRALVFSCSWLRATSRLGDASDILAEARPLVLSDPYLGVLLQIEAAYVTQDRGETDALEALEAALEAASSEGLCWSTALLCLRLGDGYSAAGRLIDANRHLSQALAVARDLRSGRLESEALLGLAAVAASEGRWEEVLACASRARDLARRDGERRALGEAFVLLALHALHAGLDRQAEAYAFEGLSVRDLRPPLTGLLALCRAFALARMGRHADASAAMAAIDEPRPDPRFDALVTELRPVFEALLVSLREGPAERAASVARLAALLDGAVAPSTPKALFYTLARSELARLAR